jgi:hypothetical protein
MEGSGVLTPVFGFLIDRFGFHTTFTTAGAAVFIVTVACGLLLLGHRMQRPARMN